jgi:hypothetical protein
MIAAYGEVTAVDHFATYAIILNRGDAPHMPLAAVTHYRDAWFGHGCTRRLF